MRYATLRHVARDAHTYCENGKGDEISTTSHTSPNISTPADDPEVLRLTQGIALDEYRIGGETAVHNLLARTGRAHLIAPVLERLRAAQQQEALDAPESPPNVADLDTYVTDAVTDITAFVTNVPAFVTQEG